jgi:hypothetical protein
MAYYLGRDVSVILNTENSTNGVTIAGAAHATGTFAANSGAAGVAVSDLVGLDIGIGVTDEDITYMGKKTVLKAEIKKETTVTMTRKKSDSTWDKIFNLARHGIEVGNGLHDGLVEPPADDVAGAANYGYKLTVTLSAAGDTMALNQCIITGHTVSLNADGTTEETLEWVTYKAPVLG